MPIHHQIAKELEIETEFLLIRPPFKGFINKKHSEYMVSNIQNATGHIKFNNLTNHKY